MDFSEDESSATESGHLVSWHCDETLWRDFKAAENKPYAGSSRASKHLALGSFAATILVLFLILLSSVLGYRNATANVGPAVIVMVIGGIFVFSGLVTYVYRRKRDASLSPSTGEITVDYDGLTINGYRCDWVFLGKGWRLTGCERKTVAGDLGSSIQVLEFRCVSRVTSTRTSFPVDITWRVPVPDAQISTVDSIIDRLNSTIRSVART